MLNYSILGVKVQLLFLCKIAETIKMLSIG